MPEPTEWHKRAVERARAAGFNPEIDAPDSLLLAEARNLTAPGSDLDKLAESLAADLEKHAAVPVTRATCAALARAAADLKGLHAIGNGSYPLLTILSAAAAKLEMRASAGG